MKNIFWLSTFVLLSAQVRADECQYPLKWVDKSLCLEVSQDRVFIENEIIRMSSLVEQDIARSSQTDLPVYFTNPGEVLSKKKLKKALSALTQLLAHDQLQEFLMVNRSLELNYEDVIPYHYPVAKELYHAIKFRLSPEEARGTEASATRLPTLRSEVQDVSGQGLKYGFNRNAADIPDGVDCKYTEPKTSYGTHPGFTVKCHKKEIKVKFGEIHSEAFGSRIFWALGYNVDAVDYLPNMVLPYDRKVFTEFNSRRLMKTRFKFGPILTKELPITLNSNPFKFIDAIELKDGTMISGKEARKFLVGNNKAKTLTDAMINVENEKLIVKIHTGPIQVQVEEESTSFGPWTWSEFGVNQSLEARGTLLLAAWLNWSDCRFDNNRLRFTMKDGKPTLQHVISDLGSVLGKAGGNLPFLNSNEKESAFENHFISRKQNGRIAFPHYRPINSNQAFNEASESDLEDMAKLIVQITPRQIEDALKASGFNDDEVQKFAAKLLNRQSEVREVFGL